MSSVVERDAGPLAQHHQRRSLGGGEVDVLAGEPADEGQLEHLREPLGAQGR